MSNLKENTKLFKNFFAGFGTFLWFLLALVLISKFVIFQQITVVGKSMEPNYHTNDQLVVNQIDKNFRRGQVVAVFEKE